MSMERNFEAAFHATAAERDALAPADVLPLNVDPRAAVTIVLGAAPRIEAWRAAIARVSPDEIARIDRLPLYAGALFFANVRYAAAAEAKDDLPKVVAAAAALRASLLAGARALARHGQIDAAPLAAITGSRGFLATATELGVLARVLRERWEGIASKTAIERAELDEAEALSERVTRAVAERKTTPERVTRASEDRRRAFTLMARAYGEARRAVTYVRWHEGDAEGIAPSLWRGRGGTRAKERTEAKMETVTDAASGALQQAIAEGKAGDSSEPASPKTQHPHLGGVHDSP